MLCLKLKPEGRLTIDTPTGQVTVVNRNRGTIRLAIDAPPAVQVARADAKKKEAREAA